MTSHFERLQIDDGDVTVRGAGHIGNRAVRLHLDTGGAASHLDALHDGARGGIEDGDVRSAQGRDEHPLAVGREFQTVGARHAGGQRLNYFPGGEVENGDGAVLRIRRPDFLAIGRDVKALGASAYGDHRLIPVRSRRPAWAATARTWTRPGTAAAAHALLDQGHGGRTNIGGNDAFQVFRNKNHVGSVLTRAEHPIYLLRHRIVTTDRLGGFRGEPDLATGVD